MTFFGFVILILLLHGAMTYAQDVNDESDAAVKLNTDIPHSESQLDEIVVTATKTEKTIAEVPQAVTSISSEEINQSGSLKVTDTFQRIPGVAVHDYNSAGFGNQLYFRGYDYLRMYKNMDFQIDGISVHSEGDYGNPLLNIIPRAAIDHIEFLRGPAAAMYGEHASIGAINTVIKTPKNVFSGEVTGSYGSWDQKNTGFGLTGSNGAFTCSLAADYSDGDSYTDFQSYKNKSVLLAPSVQMSDRTSIEGILLLSEQSVKNPIATYLTSEQINENRHQNFDRGELEMPVTFIGISLTHDLGDDLQWVIKSGYLHQKEQTYLTGDGSGNSWYDYGYDYKAERPLDSYGVETHLSFFNLGTEGSILTTGLEYHLDDAEQVTSWGGFPDKDAATKVRDYSVFAQYEWDVTEKLNITGGARADFFVTDLTDRISPDASYSDMDESSISPRVGASYEIIKDVRIFGSFGTGFRVPSAYELASDGSLNPEKSKNYEAGIKTDFLKFWETTLSFYRTDYNDLILNWGERDADTGTWRTVWNNAGEARFQGIEWANYFNIGCGFKGYAHFLFDDSKYIDYKSPADAKSPFDNSDNKIPYHPRNQVKLGLEYSYKEWTTGVHGRYYGDYYSDPSGDYIADDYVNLDLHVSYTYETAMISFYLNNVLDEEYFASAWKDTEYPAPGRNVLCKISFTF